MLRSYRTILLTLSALIPFAGSFLSADDFPVPVNTEKEKTMPMDPAEVLRTTQLPPGFQLSLIAAEPLIQNPIAMTMDERGRLWVAENYSWAGAGAGGFDPQQRDRIVILEDTDGDGIHDKRIVFWDDARMLTGLEVGNGGVWAICLPHLVFLPDRNRDDVPDSAPIVILDGFENSQKNHTPVNGLKWGPDGWLYGRQGILSTAKVGVPGASDSERFQIDTGVWRYHPQRNVAEAVMHGMTNAWGFDFDQYGEMFVINTVIGHLWHVVPGAHTERMFGVDINPYSYRLIPQVADHVHWDTGETWDNVRKGVTNSTSAAGGGHAHIGLMIYQGNNWPEEYRNQVYTLNLHGRRINADHLLQQGAGYTATHGADMCFIQDPWFRGMELLTGPDGGVYITDWSDTGECHDHDGVHRTSGRIYKLTYGTPGAVPAFDLRRQSTTELIALLSHLNTWWARQARRILTERFAAESSPNRSQVQQELLSAFNGTDHVIHRLRIMEAIATVTGAPAGWWQSRLQSGNEFERATALRFLVDQQAGNHQLNAPEFLALLKSLATTDPSGRVQLHLASTLQKLAVNSRWEIAAALAARPEFADDRMLPLMIWYGIEPAVPTDSEKALSLIKATRIPLLAELISRRITAEMDRAPQALESLLQELAAGAIPFPQETISGIAQALEGRKNLPAPAGWGPVARLHFDSTSEATRNQVLNLSVIFRDEQTIAAVRNQVSDRELSPEVRQRALRSLLISRPENYSQTLLLLLQEPSMVIDALRGLAQYDSPEIPSKILESAGRFNPAQRAEMIQTLAARPVFAGELLKAIQNGIIATSELSAFHARQIASFENSELTKLLTEVWGDVRVSAAEKKEQIGKFKTSLTPTVLAKANLPAGRVLFQKSCANCHILYGVGRRVGPDLTGSHRHNLDYLLENLVDPSASVGASFRSLVVVLKDGRVLNGVVSELNEKTLTLQSAQESLTLDRGEIDEMKTTNVSLMPEGLMQNLTPDQARDLIGYLMSQEQVPLPPDSVPQ